MAASVRTECGPVARHIATVAARLFATRGYDATSVREIVEAAGVTKPTLYYHFGSKEGLAQALLTVPMEQLAATLRAELDGPGGPVECLVRVVEAHFAFCRENPDRARFWFALLFGPLGSSLAGELCRFGERLDELKVEAVRRLAEAGSIAPDRVADCDLALRGLIIVRTLGFLYRDGELGPDLASRLVDDLLRGFGVGERGRR